jgi:hypothetical protein
MSLESESSESEPFFDSKETAGEATEAKASAADSSSDGERSERRDGGKERNPDPNPHCAAPLPRRAELSHEEATDLLWGWVHSRGLTGPSRNDLALTLRKKGYEFALAWVERRAAMRGDR